MVRRKKLLSGVLLLSGMLCTGRVMAQQWLYKQAAVPIEYRVKDLLGRMTIEEKVGQLCCPLGWEMYTKTGKNEVTVSELYKKKMAEACRLILGCTSRGSVDTKDIGNRTKS